MSEILEIFSNQKMLEKQILDNTDNNIQKGGNLEYEYRYYNVNKKEIIKQIKDLEGTKKGIFLFRVIVFIHPLEVKKTYIRVRDEGYKITLTFKSNMGDEFVNENEVIIDNFDEGCKILLGIGCKKKYYYEKIREIWNIGKTEICWDTNPGRQFDIMEVESKTKKNLDLIIKKLNIQDLPRLNYNDKYNYMETFGIVIPGNIDLTFENVKKNLLPLCTKNKKDFIHVIESQLKIYNKITKKSK